MAVGQDAFVLSAGAPLAAHELALRWEPVPDVVLVDLDGQGCVPKIEHYFFRQLFCASHQDGIGAELAAENRRILTFERGGVGAPEKELENRNQILARARAKGFEPLLTPAAPVFLCRKLIVLVPDASQIRRVQDIVRHAFIHPDKAWFQERIRAFRERSPGACPISEAALESVTEAFDQARSFTKSPGLFYDARKGLAFPDEVILRDKLPSLIDVRVVGSEVISLVRGDGQEGRTVEVCRQGNAWLVRQGGAEARIGVRPLRAVEAGFRRWRAKGAGVLRGLLAMNDDGVRVIDFGSGDALYVGSGEDFTNFAIVHKGRMLLVDPSEMTVRNLSELSLLDRVDVIYQSHVHYDHLGGMLELARRAALGDTLPPVRMLCAVPAYVQMIEVLSVYTARPSGFFEERFPLCPADRMTDSRRTPQADGEVQHVTLQGGAYDGWECHLMRTRHFVPTYAVRMATPGGVFAYLVDSSMPPRLIRGQANPQYDEFLNFFGAQSGVDVLVADCGDVEEREENVHIAPAALLRVFPEHASRGTLWTVHSPVSQKAADLQRFEPFDVVEVQPFSVRQQRMDAFAVRLLGLKAFRNRAFHVDERQAARIARVASLRRHGEGEQILRKDEDVRNPENNKVYIVMDGEVSVAEEGRAIRDGERLGPGDLFGERAIFGAEVAAMAYWQIPERRRARVATRHEFDSGAYFTWNPGLAENDIEEEFAPEPELRDSLVALFRQTQKLQRTRTAVVLSESAEVLEIKAAEFHKIFEHFAHAEEQADDSIREEKVRETLGALVLSSASASKRMRLEDFIALVELDHLSDVIDPIRQMASAKRRGDRQQIKSLKWPATVLAIWSRIDPVSKVIDANLSAFLSFARVFHDQYVAEIPAAAYLDATLATPECLNRLVQQGVLDGDSERVKAYIARYQNGKKHVKLQRQDVTKLREFAEALASPVHDTCRKPEQAHDANADALVALYEGFAPKQDVLSSLYAEWNVLMREVDTRYAPEVRELYKDYLARLQTKAIANILTILLFHRLNGRQGGTRLSLDDILLWIHSAWALDNDWAEQAAMTWDELEKIKPGDIKKDWVALFSVIEHLDMQAHFKELIAEGLARYPVHA